MTVVVVYESTYGNTHRIAEAIGAGVREAELPVEVLSIDSARERRIHPEDVLVVGAPTPVHGLNRPTTRQVLVNDAPGHDFEVDPSAHGLGVQEWLSSLNTDTGKAAAFDTRAKGPARLTGRTSRTVAKTLEQHGFEVVTGPVSFRVTSTSHLLPQEETRAQQWGVELATRLRPAQS